MWFGIDAGGSVRLELLTAAHASALFNLVDANRDHLRPWMPWVDPTRTIDDTITFIEGAVKDYASGASYQTAVFFGPLLAGAAGLQVFNRDARSCQVGYWLAADATGRGIMTRAVAALMRIGFGPLKLRRIDLVCAERNVRSAAVAERLGMTRTGTLLQEVAVATSEPEDARLYSIVADDFARRWGSGEPDPAPPEPIATETESR